MLFDVGYPMAFLAGLLSFLSPCILPIVPFYLCYLAGISFGELSDEGLDRGTRRRIVGASAMFAAGILVIFVGLGASATWLGEAVRGYQDWLRWAAAALLLVLGLHFLGVFQIALLNREARVEPGEGLAARPFGAFLIGMAFAFGWTPCVGPVLAAILFKASQAGDVWGGAALLFVYGLGMTLPFVVAALFVGPFLRWAKGFRRHLPRVQQAMGAALVVFAVLIGTNSMNEIANWMLTIAPDIGTLQ